MNWAQSTLLPSVLALNIKSATSHCLRTERQLHPQPHMLAVRMTCDCSWKSMRDPRVTSFVGRGFFIHMDRASILPGSAVPSFSAFLWVKKSCLKHPQVRRIIFLSMIWLLL